MLGLVALDERNWQEAVDLFEQALSLWEREGSRRMIGRSLLSLGSALRPMKKYAEAIAVYQKAIDIFEKIQDPLQQAVAQMNLGNVYLSLKQPHEALKFHLPAEQTFRRVQDRFYLSLAQHNIGMAYRQLQEWDRAKAAYRASIEYQQTIGNTALWVDTLDGLGLTYLEQGQFKPAIATFEEALKRLAQLEGKPGYERLLAMITGHLQNAINRKTALRRP